MNINTRWEEWGLPDHLRPIIKELQVLLPQLHMLAHQEHCQTEYAMCYKHGCRHTCGEMVEVNWAENNAVGLSTREMNASACQDAICDHLNVQNWWKNVTHGKWLHQLERISVCMLSFCANSKVPSREASGEASLATLPHAGPCGADEGGWLGVG